MKNILTLAILALSISTTSCSWFKKDKPNPDATYEDGALLNSQNVDSSNIVPLDNASTDASAQQGLNVASQEELIAVAGDRVFFATDSSSLSSDAQATLSRQANWLTQNQNVNVTIEGHCDERGTREYNIALGERRANAVKDFLVNRGVNPARVNTISYGKEFPEFLGSTEASWSKNRRGVTVVN
ncbi:MAG: peptidoglycan-associated lipoprotein Pal [Rickettsiales bacterium]|nr:peptidoglycan-associated lipoprotein Pal [Rickettsiales bacterium]